MWIIEMAAGAWPGKTIVGCFFDVMQSHIDYKHAQQRATESRARYEALMVKING